MLMWGWFRGRHHCDVFLCYSMVDAVAAELHLRDNLKLGGRPSSPPCAAGKKIKYHHTNSFVPTQPPERRTPYYSHPVNMEENTRVFVSGLPPTFSNDDLRKHFSTRYQVTDAHVIPKRRIGFVGFKTPTLAQDAANYFNKTYIRMSKIAVEMARPVRIPSHSHHFPPRYQISQILFLLGHRRRLTQLKDFMG